MAPEISCKEAFEMIHSERPPILLDVREPIERYTVHIGGIHIPMGDVAAKLDELQAYKDTPIIVYCRSGKRSMGVATFLASQGFQSVYNLRGGLLEWQKDVDSSLSVG
jgi:adenylyltransferase/sulfurtransferase